MASILKLDQIQTPAGDIIMTFGAGGLVDFNGPYEPGGFNFPSWNGAGERPPNPVIGTTGINSAIDAIECYLGLNSITGLPSWLTVTGTEI